MPKSLRFNFVLSSKLARSLPLGSFIEPRNVTGSVTSFETPCIVNVPVTAYVSLPVDATFELLKVISGNLATSKKLSERRSLSRLELLVSIDVALIVKTTEDASGLAVSAWIAPSKSAKRPWTFEAKWRMVKLTSEWALSIV